MLGALGTSYRGDEIEYIQYCQWVRYLRAHPLAPNHDIVAQSFHLREGGGDFAGDACDFFSSIKRLPGARQKFEIVTGDLTRVIKCSVKSVSYVDLLAERKSAALLQAGQANFGTETDREAVPERRDGERI